MWITTAESCWRSIRLATWIKLPSRQVRWCGETITSSQASRTIFRCRTRKHYLICSLWRQDASDSFYDGSVRVPCLFRDWVCSASLGWRSKSELENSGQGVRLEQQFL